MHRVHDAGKESVVHAVRAVEVRVHRQANACVDCVDSVARHVASRKLHLRCVKHEQPAPENGRARLSNDCVGLGAIRGRALSVVDGLHGKMPQAHKRYAVDGGVLAKEGLLLVVRPRGHKAYTVDCGVLAKECLLHVVRPLADFAPQLGPFLYRELVKEDRAIRVQALVRVLGPPVARLNVIKFVL